MKLASAGPSQPAHRRSPMPSRPALKSPRRPAPWWRRPRRPTGPKPPRIGNAAAAGQSRHRTGHARRIARLEPDAGPRAGKPVAGVGLCRSGARPAAAQQAMQQNGAIKPAAPAVARTGWIIQVGALESESEAKQRIDLARNKASSLLSKADPFTEPVVSKATARCSAPVSPASSANRPKRSAGHSSAPTFPASPFATDPSSRSTPKKPAPQAPALLFSRHSRDGIHRSATNRSDENFSSRICG